MFSFRKFAEYLFSRWWKKSVPYDKLKVRDGSKKFYMVMDFYSNKRSKLGKVYLKVLFVLFTRIYQSWLFNYSWGMFNLNFKTNIHVIKNVAKILKIPQ